MFALVAGALIAGVPPRGGLAASVVFEDASIGFVSDIVRDGDSIVVIGTTGAVTLDADLARVGQISFEGARHPMTSPAKRAVRVGAERRLAYLDAPSGYAFGEWRDVALHGADGSLLWRTRVEFPERDSYAGNIASVVPLEDEDGSLGAVAVSGVGNEQAVILSAEGEIVGRQEWGLVNGSLAAVSADVVGDDASEMIYALDSSLVCVDRAGERVFEFRAKNRWCYLNVLRPIVDDKDEGLPEFLVGVSETNALGLSHTQVELVVSFDPASGELSQRPAEAIDVARAGGIEIADSWIVVGRVADPIEGENASRLRLAARRFDPDGTLVERLDLVDGLPRREIGATIVVELDGRPVLLTGWGSTVWRIDFE